MARPGTILFDNDGVLVDTERLFFEANRRILASLGLELTESLFSEYSLTRGVTPLELAFERGVLAREQFAPRLAERDDEYEALLRDNDATIDGVAETLAALSNDYRIGVVTGSKRRHFDVIHCRSGLRGAFDFVLTREDYARSKPQPDAYLRALDVCGASAERCVAVEDSPRGVRAAVAAGLSCVAIPSPLAPEGDFSSAHASLSSIRELPTWLVSR